MQEMPPEETRAFLMDTPRTAKLATVREDGRPHVAPICFTMDGDVLVFTSRRTTVKAHNIQRDRRVSICVDDEKLPFAFVVIDGIAEIVDPTLEEFLRWTTEISGRYMGQDKAAALGKYNAIPDELLVRVTPTKINAQKDVANY